MGVLNFLTGTIGYTAIAVAVGLAVVAHFFAPRSWSALAWAVAFVLLGAAFVVQRELTAAERTAHAETRAQNADAWRKQADLTAEAHKLALAADRAVTGREQTLTATIETNAKEAQRVQTTLAADRDRARASERRLREQLDAITQRFGAVHAANANPAAAGQQPPAGDAIGVLADVLGRCDQRAGILADFADRAHAAGLACERDYDAARAELSRRHAENP